MNNLDIDDREDENDRRKIQSLRDQLAKDTEERKLVLKQMEFSNITLLQKALSVFQHPLMKMLTTGQRFKSMKIL